jgi:hypothetical protein
MEIVTADNTANKKAEKYRSRYSSSLTHELTSLARTLIVGSNLTLGMDVSCMCL